MATPSATRHSQFRAWLQLMRIANLPTAVSNVAVGYIATTSISRNDVSLFGLAPLIAASCLLYCGGMILNDAFDADKDAIDRPGRPIPSGAINRHAGFSAGFGFLLLAILIPVAALLRQTQATSCIGWLGVEKSNVWQVGIIWLLAVTILLYDGILKKTVVAPLLMGACRTLNILLGGAVIFGASVANFEFALIWFAVSIGVFVAGITMLARSEAQDTVPLIKAAVSSFVMVAGLVMVAATPLTLKAMSNARLGGPVFYIMIGILAGPIIYRLFLMIRQKTPASMGHAIVTSLTSLIFLDAAFCFLARPDRPIYAGLVALLVIPVILLRRVSAQT